MNKLFIVALVATLVSPALVSYVQAEKTAIRTIKEASDFPALQARAQAVCDSDTLKRSTKLETACKTGTFPNVIKDGSRFWDMGIGKELNILINQR